MALGMSHPLLNSLTFFLAVTLLQLAMSFVMLFVKFKMFTIIPFFLVYLDFCRLGLQSGIILALDY